MSNFKKGDKVYLEYKIDSNISETDKTIRLLNKDMSTFGWTFEKDIISPNQLQLQLPEIGKEYEFSDDGEFWYKDKLKGFYDYKNTVWNFIRPIPTPSPEELQFLELAEKFKNKYSIKHL